MFLQNIEIQGQTEKLNLERMLTAPYFYRATLCWCGDGRNPVSVCLSVCLSVSVSCLSQVGVLWNRAWARFTNHLTIHHTIIGSFS